MSLIDKKISFKETHGSKIFEGTIIDKIIISEYNKSSHHPVSYHSITGYLVELEDLKIVEVKPSQLVKIIR